MSVKSMLSAALQTRFAEYSESYPDIEVISLATADGFPVHCFARRTGEFADDTLAAAASTLYSVSNAVAQQILSKAFKITFIESEQGNVAFVALQLASHEYVLVMSAKQSMNIANLRLLINRLAGEIEKLNDI